MAEDAMFMAAGSERGRLALKAGITAPDTAELVSDYANLETAGRKGLMLIVIDACIVYIGDRGMCKQPTEYRRRFCPDRESFTCPCSPLLVGSAWSSPQLQVN
jgi:hypothetical protein